MKLKKTQCQQLNWNLPTAIKATFFWLWSFILLVISPLTCNVEEGGLSLCQVDANNTHVSSNCSNVLDNNNQSLAGTWTQLDANPTDATSMNAPWLTRANHAVVALNGVMYLFGGLDGAIYLNDVWSSRDGMTWTQLDANPTDATSMNAPWPVRANHTMVVLNGVMYLLGGIGNTTNPFNDVWSSRDGMTWTQLDADPTDATSMNAPWSARDNHTMVVFNGAMYLFGGFDRTTSLNDVWSSRDGMTWTQLDANPTDATSMNAPWSARTNHAVVVFNGAMYLFGGLDGTSYLNDVWSSRDGMTWTQLDANVFDNNNISNALWPVRGGHSVVAFNGAIYLFGGFNGTTYLNDTWGTSSIGVWSQFPEGSWSGRSWHRVVVLGNTAYLLGGSMGTIYLNDVWRVP